MRYAISNILIIYLLVHATNGDVLMQYSGQTMDQIQTMLKEQNFTYDELDQDTYNKQMEAQRHEVVPVTKPDLMNKTLTTDQRLDMLIQTLGMN